MKVTIEDGSVGDDLFVASSVPAPDGSGFIKAKHLYNERTPIHFEPGSKAPEGRAARLDMIREQTLKTQREMIDRALAFIADHGMDEYRRVSAIEDPFRQRSEIGKANNG